MQGLESLNQFQNFMSSIGGLGRFEDTYMVHAAEGETVVPMEVLDRDPLLKKRLFKSMRELGIDPGRYIVGNDLNSLNPVTGQPEFFLKKIGRRLRKAAADISGYAAPIMGAMYGPAAGAATGALLGQYKRENPGDPYQGMQMALRGGISGLGTNIASGQGFTPFGGMRGIYGQPGTYGDIVGDKAWDPVELGKRFLGDPSQMLQTGVKGGEDRKYRFMDKYFPEKTPSGASSTAQKALDVLEAKPNPEIEDIINADKLREIIKKDKKGLFGNLSFGQIATMYGLGTAGLGALIDYTSDEEDIGPELQILPEGVPYQGILNPQLTYADPVFRARGGVMDLQGGGFSQGPGTGTSDSIPAMLSDGEFVMTADAVRGAGGGNRREGARKMYETMDRLEARV